MKFQAPAPKPAPRPLHSLASRMQERGMRSGTLPHPLVAGFGEVRRQSASPTLRHRPTAAPLTRLPQACAVAEREMGRDRAHVQRLSQRLRDGLTERVPEIVLNGHSEQRYVGNLNYSFAYVEGESLVMALKDIAISSGSALALAETWQLHVARKRSPGGGNVRNPQHPQHTLL